MTRTIAERVSANAELGFVGRARELNALHAAVGADEPPFLVAFVHGPGGIGKSRLVQRLLADLPGGASGLFLDGRTVEPTPAGMHRALGVALGLPDSRSDGAAITRALRAAPRSVLVIDSYELLRLLDGWLRTAFLPALPASVLVVFAGRDRPSPAWHTAPGWSGMVAEFPLGPLPAGDAVRLLGARGLDDHQARWAHSVARGHPLALELAAATVRADPTCVDVEPPGPPGSAGLLDVFLGRLPPATVTAVEAASTVRRVTEPLLRAVLDVPDARAAFQALRGLPFTDVVHDGLMLHDVVRETVGHELTIRDPEARRGYRRRAAAFLIPRTSSSDVDPWGITADLMFLIENPVVRGACFPSARPEHAVDGARPADGDTIRAMVVRHETPTAAGVVDLWWRRHPESFRVARDPDGAVAAFVQVIALDRVDPTLLAHDPVAGRWLEHLRVEPPADGEQVLLMRRWLGRESGELRSPGVSACWLDVKRVYMEMRPRLRRIYTTIVDLTRLGPIFVPLGFAPAGTTVDMDGLAHQPVWLDFGPGSVDGWLGRLVGAETAPPSAPPPAPTRPAPTAATVAGLSARELEVLRLVADGLSNRRIGGELFISEKTAERHVTNIYAKLDVHSRAEAARIAAEHGITRCGTTGSPSRRMG